MGRVISSYMGLMYIETPYIKFITRENWNNIQLKAAEKLKEFGDIVTMTNWERHLIEL